jgi:hypothetical protein
LTPTLALTRPIRHAFYKTLFYTLLQGSASPLSPNILIKSHAFNVPFVRPKGVILDF